MENPLLINAAHLIELIQLVGGMTILLMVLPLWVDAARRGEYGLRPRYFMVALVLEILALGLLVATRLWSPGLVVPHVIPVSLAFNVIHTLALLMLEYSVHQQRIQKNHLWKAYRQGLQPIVTLMSLSVVIVLVVAAGTLMRPTEDRSAGLVDIVLFLSATVFLIFAGTSQNALNGMQDGVIRRKTYPFVFNGILLGISPLAILMSNSLSFPVITLVRSLALALFVARAFHEYFFYRMNHLSDSYRRQDENNQLRNALVNRVLRSDGAQDHEILQEAIKSYHTQLEDSVANKNHIFKSMVVYQVKGSKLAVRGPEYVYNFCSPLVSTESVKRMGKDDNIKHILSQTWDLDELKAAPTGKPQDFAIDAIRLAWSTRGPVNLEPLPPALASMYKLIHLYPVFNQDDLIGLLVLYKDRDSTHHVFPQETNILKGFADVLGIIFTIIQGKEIQEERNRLTGEMNTAKNIQTSILPRTIDLPGYEATAVMKTATEVGGDLYDFVVGSGANYLDIGDVSGHGLPSGLMALIQMSAFQGALYSAETAGRVFSASEIYDIVNKTLVRINRSRIGSDKFMTCNILQEKDGLFVHAGAHLPALVYRKATHTVEEVPGMTDRTAFLGISDLIQSKTSEGSFKLESGDMLFLYTDGLVEARDRDGRFFGTDQVKQAILDEAASPVDRIKDHVLERLAQFAAAGDLKKYGGVYADDVSLVVLRRL